MANFRMTKSIMRRLQCFNDTIEDARRASLKAAGITGREAAMVLPWLGCRRKYIDEDSVECIDEDDETEIPYYEPESVIFCCGKNNQYADYYVSKNVIEFLKNYDEHDLPAKREKDDWWNSLQRKAQHIAEIKLWHDGEYTL